MIQIQDDFMKKHPHHIPLLLMYDVINGMETIFPIPLAQGCTFSPEMVRGYQGSSASAGEELPVKDGSFETILKANSITTFVVE